jgi:pyruvate dehydrogenase E2 component (dihydrolipoamide acetyltransferase)
MTEVLMPRLDPGMQSGKIVEWLKKEGDSVTKGQAIVVVEGEKTTFEVEAPESGKLSKILAIVGDDVEVSQPIAIIGESTRSPSQTTPSHQVEHPSAESTQTTARLVTRPSSGTERSVASPAARRLAQEYGIDLSKVTGTGPGGRISREDVLAASDQAQKPLQAVSVVSKTRQPQIMRKTRLESVRKAVAERLSFSARNVVPVTLTMDADALRLMRLKDEHHFSFNSFAIKAVAKALEKHPMMNSSIEGDEITTYSDVNVCVAINTEQGLVAPTVFNANKKSLREINGEIEALADKAKAGQLTLENLTGGTFTVTNLGACDVDSFAPVINPPQCGILGLGRVAYKPYASGDQISSRPSTVLTLVFDHRIIDGLPAARFLQDVKRNLEDPETLI